MRLIRHPRMSLAICLSFALTALAFGTISTGPAFERAVFVASADAFVTQAAPNTNYGTYSQLFQGSNPLAAGFLRFDVAGLTGRVTNAFLRVFTNSTSSNGLQARAVDPTPWSEKTITFDNAPAISRSVIGSSGQFATGMWTTIDVTRGFSGDRSVSFALTSFASRVSIASRRDSIMRAPQLVVTSQKRTWRNAPKNLKATLTSLGVALSWSAPSLSSAVAGYTVYRNGSVLATVAAPTTTYTDGKVAPDATYMYAVDALDSSGNHSQRSVSVTISTPAGPAPSTSPSPGPTPTLNLTPSPSPTTPLATSPSPTPSTTSPGTFPTPTSSTGSGSVSGQAIPLGDLSGWHQIFADDFTIGAPLGSWGTSDPSKVVYTGDHGGKWVEYPDGWPSTNTNGAPGYYPSQVLSVHDGVLDFWLRNYNGAPAGANPAPLLPNGTTYQTYGRYVVRFKATYGDSYRLRDFHIAWLLWPKADSDWQYAESDYPEADLNDTSVCAYAHYGGAGSQDSFCKNIDFTQWHTFTQEWGPGYRSYYLDGTMLGTSTKQVFGQAERWQLQTEPSGNNDGDSGHLLVDWVVAYSRA